MTMRAPRLAVPAHMGSAAGALGRLLPVRTGRFGLGAKMIFSVLSEATREAGSRCRSEPRWQSWSQAGRGSEFQRDRAEERPRSCRGS